EPLVIRPVDVLDEPKHRLDVVNRQGYRRTPVQRVRPQPRRPAPEGLLHGSTDRVPERLPSARVEANGTIPRDMPQSRLYVALKAIQKDRIVLQDHDPVSVGVVGHHPREIMVADGARAALVHREDGPQRPGQVVRILPPGVMPDYRVFDSHPSTSISGSALHARLLVLPPREVVAFLGLEDRVDVSAPRENVSKELPCHVVERPHVADPGSALLPALNFVNVVVVPELRDLLGE